MQDRFLKACYLEEVDTTPIWLMRQAGRYMAEYREIRQCYGFLEMCKKPRVAAEITLQPVKKFKVDAAILFSDLLIPAEAMGAEVEFKENHGPKIKNPVNSLEDVENLEIASHENFNFVEREIRILKEELKLSVPLIGFAGAPFTLASYLIEGGATSSFVKTRKFMLTQKKAFDLLLKKISESIINFVALQVEAGVDAIQIFDTWAGCLSPRDYEAFVLKHTKRVIKKFEKKLPVINFAKDAGSLLELRKKAGGSVFAVDWRISLDKAWKIVGYDKAIQGNLDPAVLLASKREVVKGAKEIIEKAAWKNGHIFNLGHGIVKDTPEENVEVLVKAVHKYGKR